MMSLLEFAEMSQTKATKAQIKTALACFLEYVRTGEIAQELKSRIRSEKEYAQLDWFSIEYLESGRDCQADLLRFAMAYRQIWSPNTIRGRVNFTRQWLELNDVIFKPTHLKMLKTRIPKIRTLTEDEPLTHDIIRQWCNHLKLHGRVIVLCLMSSGMRIGELLSLRFDDVNLDSDPAEVIIREEISKNKTARYTFLSPEAVDGIREWLKIRDRWLLSATCRGKGIGKEKRLDDDRIFPFSQMTINRMFQNALKSAGLLQIDEKTKRATITAHSLRKFFITQMKTVMNDEMVELLVGHTGYLSGSYRRIPKGTVAEEYRKLYYAISLYSPENLPELKTRLETAENSSKYLMGQMVHNASEMERMKAEIAKLKDENERQYKLTEEIVESMLKDMGLLDD